ncbi:MAG: prolyl oligopeptidase family serine peptidase [Armatimonadetes bacterium]|nr:prolyl oligopeptidase family serine peptidase [Armatimonadota bacterium]
MIRLDLLLLCAALGAGQAARAEEPPEPVRQTFEVDGHRAFVMLPEKAPKPTPWVWYAPTLPGLPEPRENWMFGRWLARGIAIAGIDVGESHGSPAGRAVCQKLYDELTGQRGFALKACLLARSRGGLMLYNWAAEHADAVACIAGIYPVCNLRSYPGLDKACGAYGLTAAELEAQLAQHNPIDRLAPLAKAGVPILHIHGDVDTVVPLADNSGEVAKRYEALGGKMQLIVPPGQGHNLWEGFFQCQELVDFVLANSAGPKGQ